MLFLRKHSRPRSVSDLSHQGVLLSFPQAVNNPEVATAKKMKKNKNRKKAVRDDRLKRKKKTKISVYEHKN